MCLCLKSQQDEDCRVYQVLPESKAYGACLSNCVRKPSQIRLNILLTPTLIKKAIYTRILSNVGQYLAKNYGRYEQTNVDTGAIGIRIYEPLTSAIETFYRLSHSFTITVVERGTLFIFCFFNFFALAKSLGHMKRPF